MIYIIATLSAIIWHIKLKHFWKATLGSTITATLISWALLSSHFGWLDKTFVNNLILTVSISFVISVIIGILSTSIVQNKDNESVMAIIGKWAHEDYK